MNVKRYVAASSREALRKVKNELGADAVILSNRKIPGGVEIMALADSDMTNLVDNRQQDAPKASVEDKAKQRKSDLEAVYGQTAIGAETTPTASAYQTQAPQPDADRQPDKNLENVPRLTQQVEVPQLPKHIPETVITEEFVRSLMNEIHTMKSTLEEQLASVAWGNATQRSPEKMKMLGTLLNVGFSPLLSRRLVDKLPGGLTYLQNLKQAVSALAFNLQTAASDEMIQHGGIYTLLGATGVGKTTTIAKVAARCVIRHGADKVALLTTDSYRIGGHEQLRIYGRLLGLPVRNIQDSEDLRLTLSELRNKHIVLIDTIGMSHRDKMVAEQIATFNQANPAIKKMLVMSATSSGSTLDEIITAYSKYGIHGCMITKLDETASLGAALDAIIRRKLVLHYVTTGQKVPEDIHPADGRYLLHQIFTAKSVETAFTLQDAEYALVMAKSSPHAAAAAQTHSGAKHD